LTFIEKNIKYKSKTKKNKKMRRKNYALEGTSYLIESILGLIMTIILFSVLKNMKTDWTSIVRGASLGICLLLDGLSIWRSVEMKKFARKRKNEGKGSGLSAEIVYQNEKKTIYLIIKMIIIVFLFSKPFW